MKGFVLAFLVVVTIAAGSAALAHTGGVGPTARRTGFVAVNSPAISANGITLRGSFGQAIVGTGQSSGTELCTGFWCDWPFLHQTYLPFVLRDL